MDTDLHEHRPHRPDGVLEDEINLFLERVEDLDTAELTVSVSGGRAKLQGRVSSQRERNLAEHVAAAVDGVTGVDNELIIAH